MNHVSNDKKRLKIIHQYSKPYNINITIPLKNVDSKKKNQPEGFVLLCLDFKYIVLKIA